jgi:two-component system NtrC family response regulator
VRQLENVIERLLVLATSSLVTESDLPAELQQHHLIQGPLWFELPEGGISLEAMEKELIVRALERFHGNQTHAAKYLDISRRTLIYRMEKFGIATAPSTESAGNPA